MTMDTTSPHRPTDEDLYDLAEVFNSDPVPAMRRALELWGQSAPIVPPELIRALELAEAGLSDIGDADRETGDDLAWAEARAARDLPRIRQALNLWRDQAAAAPVAQPEPEAKRDAVIAAVAEALGNAYDCLRVWEAWRVGTMGEDDFVLVTEDPDRVAEIADAAIEAMRPAVAPVAVDVGKVGEVREWLESHAATPAVPRPEGDWFTVAMVAQDMRSRGLADQACGDELLKLANSNRSQSARLDRPAVAPVAVEALQRLCRWGGFMGSPRYSADVVLGVVDWIDGGMTGPLPPLPDYIAARATTTQEAQP
jgi:hypothetical protein